MNTPSISTTIKERLAALASQDNSSGIKAKFDNDEERVTKFTFDF